jgi:hypothetical protein
VSWQPFDTALVIARLQTQAAQLQQVGGAADYAAVQSLTSFRTPSAFVVLAGEQDISPDVDAPQRRPSAAQQVETTFGVVVAVQNFRDASGEAAADDASPVITAVREAIAGWTPDQKRYRPIRWRMGDVLDYDANTLLWMDVFTINHFFS